MPRLLSLRHQLCRRRLRCGRVCRPLGQHACGVLRGHLRQLLRFHPHRAKRTQTPVANTLILNRDFAYLDDELDDNDDPIPRLTPNGDYSAGADFTVKDCCDYDIEFWTYTPLVVTIAVPPP